MLLWLLFVLSSCVCQGQPAVVGSAGLWSGGLTIPWSGAQAARDFPQGTRTSTGYSLGLTIGKTAPGLATDFMSIGVHRRFKVFHAALFGSAVGDRLYSEYGLGIRGGLSTPQWALGLGLDGHGRQIERRFRIWPSICAGLSLFLTPNTSLHIRSSFLAKQSPDDPLIADGFSSAWLIKHKMGRTQIMGFMQQWETKGWDTGIACLFGLSPEWEATACGSAVGRRFSISLQGLLKSWRISASGMISPLPLPGTLIDLQYASGIRSP